jgi:hypothetical protein
MLLATKCDLPRAVSQQEARAFAERLDMTYAETSSLLRQNVVESFQQLAELAAGNQSDVADEYARMCSALEPSSSLQLHTRNLHDGAGTHCPLELCLACSVAHPAVEQPLSIRGLLVL